MGKGAKEDSLGMGMAMRAWMEREQVKSFFVRLCFEHDCWLSVLCFIFLLQASCSSPFSDSLNRFKQLYYVFASYDRDYHAHSDLLLRAQVENWMCDLVPQQ